MHQEINKKNDHILIKLSNIENKDLLLKNLNECKEGKCSCPTSEYEKLDNLSIFVDNMSNEINLDLKPKKGKEFSVKEIQKCLDYSNK